MLVQITCLLSLYALGIHLRCLCARRGLASSFDCLSIFEWTFRTKKNAFFLSGSFITGFNFSILISYIFLFLHSLCSSCHFHITFSILFIVFPCETHSLRSEFRTVTPKYSGIFNASIMSSPWNSTFLRRIFEPFGFSYALSCLSSVFFPSFFFFLLWLCVFDTVVTLVVSRRTQRRKKNNTQNNLSSLTTWKRRKLCMRRMKWATEQNTQRNDCLKWCECVKRAQSRERYLCDSHLTHSHIRFTQMLAGRKLRTLEKYRASNAWK